MTVRGITNNNPLNLRIVAGNRWQGRIEPAENTDHAFEQFTDPLWGIRAAAIVLKRHHIAGAITIAKHIAIWAPASENDTSAYAKTVAHLCGWSGDAIFAFDRAHALPLIRAMITVECGTCPYSDTLLVESLAAAGVI